GSASALIIAGAGCALEPVSGAHAASAVLLCRAVVVHRAATAADGPSARIRRRTGLLLQRRTTARALAARSDSRHVVCAVSGSAAGAAGRVAAAGPVAAVAVPAARRPVTRALLA